MNLLDPSWVELLRVFDALFATVLVGVVAGRTWKYWSFFDHQQRLLILSYQFYLMAIAYTSFELYAQQATIGYRSYIVLAANVFAAFAFATNRKPGLMTMTQENRLRFLEAEKSRTKR